MPFVQQEKLGIGPNIARVERHEKRQIANQADASRTGVFLNSAALPEEQELRKAYLFDVGRKLPSRRVQGLRRTLDQLQRPIEVRSAVMRGLQGAEQRVIVKPVP